MNSILYLDKNIVVFKGANPIVPYEDYLSEGLEMEKESESPFGAQYKNVLSSVTGLLELFEDEECDKTDIDFAYESILLSLKYLYNKRAQGE